MNRTIKTTAEPLVLQVSELMCLFEAKGYNCEEIKNLKDTVYIFKAERHEYIDYNLQPNPNWQVVRSPGVDWL